MVSSLPVLNWTIFASARNRHRLLDVAWSSASALTVTSPRCCNSNVLFDELTESREFDRDAIRPGFYKIEKIVACLIRLAFCCYTRARVDDSDCGPADGRLARIRDSALDTTAEFLRKRTGSEQRCQQTERYMPAF